MLMHLNERMSEQSKKNHKTDVVLADEKFVASNFQVSIQRAIWCNENRFTGPRAFTFNYTNQNSMPTFVDQAAVIRLLLNDESIGSFINEIVDKRIEDKIKGRLVTSEKESSSDYNISDSEAEAMIRNLLDKFKESGKIKADLLDIVYELGLHPDQIIRIMDSLLSEGVRYEQSTE